MTISENGLNLIKNAEGLRLTSYKCQAGVWTIGFGSTKDVVEGMTITAEEADKRLREDVRWAEKVVNLNCMGLNQHQFDALVSFVFNVGSGNFRSSTLLKKVTKDPNDPTIRDEFMKWIKAGGEVSEGLRARRKRESDLYFFK